MDIQQKTINNRIYYLEQFQSYLSSIDDTFYFNRYKKFILSRPIRFKNKKNKQLLEKHHIFLASLGGPKNENLIYLLPREHYIAHLLLSKINNEKCKKAFYYVTFYNLQLNSRKYSLLKEDMYLLRRELYSGKNNPMYGKDWRKNKTEEDLLLHRKRISEATKGNKNPMYGKDWREGKPLEEIENHNKKISEANKGKKCSAESIEKRVNKTKGRKRTEEFKCRMSSIMSGHNRSEESIQKQKESIKGGKNPKAKRIKCVESDEIFECIKFAQEAFKGVLSISSILKSLKLGIPIKGYLFIYV